MVQADKLGGASAPAAAAASKPSQEPKNEDGPEEQQQQGRRGGAWWQWLLVFIAMPLLLIISLVGVVVWLLVLPLKCFCCPLGCAAQLIWSVVEWFLKAPFRAMLWASGKPWQPQKPPDPHAAKHGDKANKDKVPPV